MFAERNVLIDLTGYLDADPLRDELYPYARKVGVYDGRNYITPFNSCNWASCGFTASTPVKVRWTSRW